MNYRVLAANEALNDIFDFYVIHDEKQEVYVLRVIKHLMNWQKILRRTKVYHF